MHDQRFEGWVVVQLMGHTTLTGQACEIDMLGGRVLRLDLALPAGEEPCVQFYPLHALFSVTPVSAEKAEEGAANNLRQLRTQGLRAWPETPTPTSGRRYIGTDDLHLGGLPEIERQRAPGDPLPELPSTNKRGFYRLDGDGSQIREYGDGLD